MAKSFNKTAQKQIEHDDKMMEDNLELAYEFVKQAVIAKAEKTLVDWKNMSLVSKSLIIN